MEFYLVEFARILVRDPSDDSGYPNATENLLCEVDRSVAILGRQYSRLSGTTVAATLGRGVG